MTIKEASKVTDIGYENAKAIKKAYDRVRLGGQQEDFNDQKAIYPLKTQKALNKWEPSLLASMQTSTSE